MDFIKKVPVPLSGVMLGAAALGNLLQSYGEGIRTVCGLFAAFMLILLLLKLVMFPGMIKEDLNNPIMASVAATFPMALMLLSTYVKPLIGPAAMYIWYFAIALHVVLIIYFTMKFMLPPAPPKVFASYFIVYVGIAVASVTAPAYEQQSLGNILFWFAFVCFICLFILVTMAYSKTEKPEPARPLICIYAADLSLAAGAACGIFGIFLWLRAGNPAGAVFGAGAALTCAGLAILLFFACIWLTRGLIRGTGRILTGLKTSLVGKGNDYE